MEEKCRIYILADPRIPDDIKYVGRTIKTLEERLNSHINAARYKKSKARSSSWVKSLLKENINPIISEIDICSINNCAWTESYWISQFKAWGFNLLNHLEYSDINLKVGMPWDQMYGKKESAVRRKKLSDTFKKKISNNEIPFTLNIYWKGKEKSEEHIKKSADKRRGVKRSDETRKKMSIACTGRIMKESTKLKLSKIFSQKRMNKNIGKYDVNMNLVKEYSYYDEIIKEHPNCKKNTLVKYLYDDKNKIYNGYIFKFINK